jgi:hypothetical protein
MKQKVNNILKGKFLVDEESFKNWRMIIFLSVLALIMIASSHRADEKVHEIAKLKTDVQELRSEYVAARLELRKLKMLSAVTNRVAYRGIVPSDAPPKKIKVKTKKQE